MTPTATRRDFLMSAAATTVGLSALPATASLTATPATADAVIWINMVGGPSQLDTFDPKPAAPSAVRGPFRPIPTRTPGVYFSELFPKLAAISDKFSLIRSLHHTAAPVHETGFQLLQTGKLFGDGPEWPHMGAVVSHLLGSCGAEPWWLLPGEDVNTGMNVSHGFGTGNLTLSEPPYHFDPMFEANPFRGCTVAAAAAVEVGARFITLNMFPTVFDAPSWDCHAAGGSLATSLADYRDTVAPTFDEVFSFLLLALEHRGLLDRTLVVATGEFGRTPYLNASGGRDHWPGCWTALVAGGGVPGGRVIGSSDRLGGEPIDRPVSPPELVATVYRALGIAPTTTIPGPHGSPVPVVDAAPIVELF